jgi:type I restriction enzyme S subunit
MKNIVRRRLGDITTLITKGTTPTTLGYEFQNIGVNFLKIECFDDNGNFIADKVAHVSEECNQKLKRSQLQSGDILFSIAGAIGRVAIVTEEMLPANTNQALAIIRIKNEDIYLPYVKLILTSPIVKEQFEKKKQGVAQLNLSLKDISDLYIPIPDKKKQIEYANLFDKIYKIIRERKQEIQKLDELIKARFVEMFGDCKTNPKAWKTRHLEEVAEVGSSKRVFVEELQETGIPFYRGTEVGVLAEGKTVDPELFITEEHYKSLCKATGTPQMGDLLMPSICPDGRIWVVNTNTPFYFKDGRVLWVHDIVPSYNPIFLLYTLKDRIMTDYSSIASGTTFAELKIFALKKCQIFDVPIELQNQFADFVTQVDKSKVAVQKALDETQLLFDCLMQEYFG